jgi:hypothetical protein
VSTRAAPFGLVAGPAPVATACHEAFGSTILEKKSLDWQRLESRGLGEMLGAPEVLIYGAGKEIVVHIPRIWEVEKLLQPNRRRVVWDSS